MADSQNVQVRFEPRHPALSSRLAKFDEAREPAEYATHLDAWVNGNTGIGTARDKVTATAFQTTTGSLQPSLLEDLYHNDDVAARICDKLPKTALRRKWTLKDPKLQKHMEQLNARQQFRKAAIFGRLYGGAPIILGGSGPSDSPLTSGVKSMLVVDRFTLAVWEYYTNPAEPNYGLPMTYRITRPGFFGAGGNIDPPNPDEIIHESRVIVFPGAETSPRRKLALGGWDDSVLQRCYQVVQAYGLTWASVVHLLQDAAQGVYKMKDLWNMIVGGNKDAVQQRMATVDEQRSSVKMILVDAENEGFERVKTPFQSIPELIDRISERLASAAEYPLTVLMGSSPAGMNATGESDLEIFYGTCEDWREDVITPAIQKFARADGMADDDLGITYPPLWLPSAKEQAETRYAVAQADNIYHEMGLPAEDIVKSRFRSSGWNPDTILPDDVRLNPPMAMATAAAGAPPVGEGAGTSIGTHHFSPKYGR